MLKDSIDPGHGGSVGKKLVAHGSYDGKHAIGVGCIVQHRLRQDRFRGAKAGKYDKRGFCRPGRRYGQVIVGSAVFGIENDLFKVLAKAEQGQQEQDKDKTHGTKDFRESRYSGAKIIII